MSTVTHFPLKETLCSDDKQCMINMRAGGGVMWIKERPSRGGIYRNMPDHKYKEIFLCVTTNRNKQSCLEREQHEQLMEE